MDRRTTAEELIAQVKANGYKIGARKDRDQVRHHEKHVKKTRKDQDAILQRYVLWHLVEMRRNCAERHLPSLPSKEMAREHCLRPGVEASDLVTMKDFLRFYIAISRSQLSNKPTIDLINSVAEWCFNGFIDNVHHRWVATFGGQ